MSINSLSKTTISYMVLFYSHPTLALITMCQIYLLSPIYRRASTLNMYIDKATELCSRINTLCLEKYCCLFDIPLI